MYSGYPKKCFQWNRRKRSLGVPGKFDTAESLSVVGRYLQALLFCFQVFP